MKGTVAIVTLLAALPAAARAELPPPRAVRVMTTETSERVPLPSLRGSVELTVDAFSAKVRLRSTGESPLVLEKALAPHLGSLCPDIRVADGAVELTCRSRRFDAELNRSAGKTYLDINEVRGIPWRPGPDGPISYHFEPWRSGLGQGCPGRSEAARGECELKQGHEIEAALHFRAALEGTGRQAACLRLGDLALGVGDPTVAMGWYRRVGPVGAFGRVATARMCEIDGSCLDSSDSLWAVFKPDGLPEPLRAEMLFRGVRAELYMGRLDAAIEVMSRLQRTQGMNSICREKGEPLCRRIILTALRASAARRDDAGRKPIAEGKRDGHRVQGGAGGGGGGSGPGGAGGAGGQGGRARADGNDDAGDPGGHGAVDAATADDRLIELYLALPAWDKGPLALELAQAAAPVIAHVGAPMFAGNLLSALAPQVPAARLSDHLLLAAETFLSGENWARARLVVEYGQSRLDRKTLSSARWTKVIRRVMGNGDLAEISPAVRGAIEAEMAETLTALKAARHTLDQARSLLGGLRDTEPPPKVGSR